MTRTHLLGAAATVLSVALLACNDLGTRPTPPVPSLLISDGAHSGGNAHFYFLPPMVPQPAWSGTFDASLSPVVRVTQGTTLVASLSADVDLTSETYQANWHTGEFALDPSLTYRITVLVGTQELGFADVDVVSSGRELKNVNTGEYVALLDDRTLPIKVRIEAGALSSPELIVFQRGSFADNALDQEIWTIRPDASGETQLTNNAASDARPTISPDGSRIAFASDRGKPATELAIWTMNIDGSIPAQLTTAAGLNTAPAWSPDGNRIAYSSTGENPNWGSANPWIVVMNADGTGKAAIDSGYGAPRNNPVWSKDATRLFFAQGTAGTTAVYSMALDGTASVRLTTEPSGDWPDVGALSPDGARLVFTSLRDGNREIYVMNTDGTGQTNLTNNPADDQMGAWSPDGTRIVFASTRGGTSQLFVMNADGSNVVQLTRTSLYDYYPHWR